MQLSKQRGKDLPVSPLLLQKHSPSPRKTPGAWAGFLLSLLCTRAVPHSQDAQATADSLPVPAPCCAHSGLVHLQEQLLG